MDTAVTKRMHRLRASLLSFLFFTECNQRVISAFLFEPVYPKAEMRLEHAHSIEVIEIV
jgi:hypothetical protein